MSVPVTLIAGSLGPNPCYTSEQARYNAFTAATQASLPDGYTTIIESQSAPGPDDRYKIWLQVDGNNRIVGFFTFTNGSWQMAAPASPYLNPGEIREYDPNFYTPIAPWFPMDGTVTGVANRQGYLVVGAGQRTLTAAQVASGDTASIFVAGTAQGRENALLTAQNMPAHGQNLNGEKISFSASPGGLVFGVYDPGALSSTPTAGYVSGGNTTGLDVNGNPNPPIATPIIPPVLPTYWMQWRPDLA